MIAGSIQLLLFCFVRSWQGSWAHYEEPLQQRSDISQSLSKAQVPSKPLVWMLMRGPSDSSSSFSTAFLPTSRNQLVSRSLFARQHHRQVAAGSVSMQQRLPSRENAPPVKEESARSAGLALALDDGTRKSHSMAENTQFVSGFFKGISTRTAFSQLVASLFFIYSAMESCFDATEDSNVKALDYPELRRAKALKEDMQYYFGDAADDVKMSPATQKYVDRVNAVARDQPYLLVAHQYTRYLGDLFGGQMMSGMARNSLQLDEGFGTRFYEFEDISSVKAFIENWYAEVNKLELSEQQKQEIIDEANLVFALNIEVFNELESSKRATVSAVWRLFKSAFKSNIFRMKQP